MAVTANKRKEQKKKKRIKKIVKIQIKKLSILQYISHTNKQQQKKTIIMVKSLNNRRIAYIMFSSLS